MKKIIIITFILVFSTTFGQKLSFKELFQISKCNSYECFGDFMKTKGNSFYEINEENGSHFYHSTKEYTSNNIVVCANFYGFLFGENGCQTLVAQTVEKAYYNQLLNEIKSFGFIFSNTTKDEQGINNFFILKSNPNVIVNIIFYSSEEKGYNHLNYQILIDRCR